MKSIIKIISIVSFLSFLIGCKNKNNESLPQTKKGAFNMKINGLLWLPKDRNWSLVSSPTKYAGYSMADSTLNINAYNDYSRISISVKTNSEGLFFAVGNKKIKLIGSDSVIYKNQTSFEFNSNYENGYYLTDSSLSKVRITQLEKQEMVSGTFEMTLYNKHGRSIKITEGVFDLELD